MRVPLVIVLAGALILVVTVLAAVLCDVPMSVLTRDPARIAGVPYYTGALSNLGIVLWSAAATLCFVGFLFLRSRDGRRDRAAFFLCSGLLTTWMLLDDLYQFHERVIPRLLGTPENLYYVFYAVLLAVYLAVFAGRIRRTNYVILLLALVWFAISVTEDFFHLFGRGDLHYLLEDGSKLLGISGWLAYFGQSCMRELSHSA